jgi:hypothetical protein
MHHVSSVFYWVPSATHTHTHMMLMRMNECEHWSSGRGMNKYQTSLACATNGKLMENFFIYHAEKLFSLSRKCIKLLSIFPLFYLRHIKIQARAESFTNLFGVKMREYFRNWWCKHLRNFTAKLRFFRSFSGRKIIINWSSVFAAEEWKGEELFSIFLRTQFNIYFHPHSHHSSCNCVCVHGGACTIDWKGFTTMFMQMHELKALSMATIWKMRHTNMEWIAI